jgi:predicted cobalt transporter CbtA
LTALLESLASPFLPRTFKMPLKSQFKVFLVAAAISDFLFWIAINLKRIKLIGNYRRRFAASFISHFPTFFLFRSSMIIIF